MVSAFRFGISTMISCLVFRSVSTRRAFVVVLFRLYTVSISQCPNTFRSTTSSGRFSMLSPALALAWSFFVFTFL